MKMPEEKDDEMLEGFFAEMKQRDQEMTIPPFPKQKKPKKWILVPMGIAASLFLFMWLRTDSEQVDKLDHDVVIITMEEGLDQEMKFDIQTASSIDIWEAPTSSLLTEF
ncbi:MAG TPA: hypothetical protein VK921_06115 [Anditalea sp.]|nr:hypothetical protein [Anditalea sp.]